MVEHKPIYPLTENDIHILLNECPDCRLVSSDRINKIIQVLKFSCYLDSINFLLKVGYKAESMQHHPKIICEWNHVTLEWWTHSHKGLTTADSRMIKEVQALFHSFRHNQSE
ncbi:MULTISPECIES: 4a-hydroxytetrahydrobiopterin dehydratase [unclassified Brenneria]|uniref:4a-hydroxytetrahydrobiopterin dehydratase n=1 Tax=unclassified Brenneria TaxID=2634434 RepID=UPI001553C084|nr:MULTISPECIES: 4a-hydroxytetrahydrobiopterin dehydratase [unclassified Brenneria]MBJ7221437.1 4a-hydroxytetrahydrobiopterin dehydratase [Brenneria sp. L3-3C-1]MEE3642680.1 4a-hydroxytetrahydrobiopterin dehydratase [Brenneria sp. L3_3C_1]MEE3652593.1 4a-hydroxytetrahydrobiopterin dehydratase [Brenneria sp. HEZEL_4_2_4]NPD02550.1 4a-hydroxytetrahydrobiopterin dehydratase [Brenneria sp. hezel4-2-4]